MIGLRKFTMAFALWALCLCPMLASAQALPVQVSVSGDTATAIVGNPLNPLADLTLVFEGAHGLSPPSLGLTAQLVGLTDTALLSRLPNAVLNPLDAAFPLLLTIEPPLTGGLKFRTVRVEVHTHALAYAAGSSYRLFKAPLSGNFRDITDEIAPGSVRARGTTGGFSQFLVLSDLRPTGSVVAAKIALLRLRVATLPAVERLPFKVRLDAIEDALAVDDYALAIAKTRQIATRAATRAGTYLEDEWRATRDADNEAGDLIAGAATLEFSIAYLRDFGQ